MLFSRPGKESLGGSNVTPFAQEKVDGSTLLIDGAIEVDPLAFYFDVGFIHTPGVADWPCVMIPALFKLRDILLHPPKNSRMGQRDATFRHHLDQVTEAQFKCDVPSHTQNDDFCVKVPSLEQILYRGRFRHPGSYRRIPSLSRFRTRTIPGLVHAIFPGQDGGLALAEILFGDVNPSGKLPFTFEKQFEDNPAYSNYPNDLSVDATGNTAVYREGIFTGYRGFEKNGVNPQFEFGFGLSYTTFSYSDLDIEPTKFREDRKADGDR